MDCKAAQKQISPWLDEELDGQPASELQKHYEECPECRGKVSALREVQSRMDTLRDIPTGDVPIGLLAGVRGLPEWWVRLAVLRTWLLAGILATTVVVSALIFLPLRSEPPSTALLQGTTLLAKEGESVKMLLGSSGGSLELQGPGALMVRQASVGGWVRRTHRLEIDLTGGIVSLWFGTGAPAHEIRLFTPQAMIRLTGTWVNVQASPSETVLEVMEGWAEIHNLSTGRTITVTMGETAQIKGGDIVIKGMTAGMPMIPIKRVTQTEGPEKPSADAEELPENPPPKVFYEMKK